MASFYKGSIVRNHLCRHIFKDVFMERELLITVSKSNNDKKKIDREIENIKRLFPYLESFQTFTESHEVMDLEKHSIINARPRLQDIFKKGIQKNSSFVISLN